MLHDAYEIIGSDRSGRWLISCDHASNRVPDWVADGDLGLPPQDMARHIAYDVGARGLALALGEALDSPVIASRFSRLVIDPNRGEDDPTLVMRLYDGTIIPANRHIDEAGIKERLDRLYRPYHAAYAELAAQSSRAILAVHSFTPQLKGRAPRPWQVGILHSHRDSRLALPLIAALAEDATLCIGDNQPYNGHLPGDAIDRHALSHSRPNALIELRNDLIEDEAGQSEWAKRLAPVLTETLAKTGL